MVLFPGQVRVYPYKRISATQYFTAVKMGYSITDIYRECREAEDIYLMQFDIWGEKSTKSFLLVSGSHQSIKDSRFYAAKSDVNRCGHKNKFVKHDAIFIFNL